MGYFDPIMQHSAENNQFAFHSFLLAPDTDYYQSRLILIALFQHDLINVTYLTACYLYQVMMTLHFLNDVANDAKINTKIEN